MKCKNASPNTADIWDYDIEIVETSSDDEGKRLDKFLASFCSELSRTRIQKLIDSGQIRKPPFNSSQQLSSNYKIKPGDVFEIRIPPPENLEIEPLPIPLPIIYEDKHLLIIDKPAGLVVHPGAGREPETLVHALLHHCNDLSGIGGKLRPGIVHRLDKDTSGIMVVAKDDKSHTELIRQFQHGEVGKKYLALVFRHMDALQGVVEGPIGRHPVHRKKMCINIHRGKTARTDWKVIREFPGATLVELIIHTGRTHQIRVHMSDLGHPLLGDALYGGPLKIKVRDRWVEFPRQMLHASFLKLTHPTTGERMSWESPLPDDMTHAIKELSA